MKRLFMTFAALAAVCMLSAQSSYKPVGGGIMSPWGEKIEAKAVSFSAVDDHSTEFPRPLVERDHWILLDGLWMYDIVPSGQQPSFDKSRQILVPFAVESALSGVGKRVGGENELWYSLDMPGRELLASSCGTEGGRWLLHFGAVDWSAEVIVNGKLLATHQGGYTPFSVDVTDCLSSSTNCLTVRVKDSTDEGYQPRGKQVNNPNGIWYTPVTGIWQSVWIEWVPERYIGSLTTTPDLDNSTFVVSASVEGERRGDKIVVELFDAEGKKVAKAKTEVGAKGCLDVKNPNLWSPESPYIYSMKVSLVDEKGKTVDCVDSYTAMRKYSYGKDNEGVVRFMLNNRPYFMHGPLDQGWWPDGLYTAPCNEALRFDVQKTKQWGFNMIRKHVKVEPAVWYGYCDRIGLLVWQDMPSGDLGGAPWQNKQYMDAAEKERSAASEACFRKEWREIIDYLCSYPCIAVWVPFNEAWGQFKTVEIVDWTKSYDPTRLVNTASGGNHFKAGDILDLHNYPHPEMYLFDAERVNVLGEYGGIGHVVKGHLWDNSEKNWGYVKYDTPEKVTDEYANYAKQLIELIHKGFSASVYTQTTDVENEVNGIMTYDRKVVKMNEQRLKQVNDSITGAYNNR